MILSRHSELPTTIPLFGHEPYRAEFPWQLFNPRFVKTANDLPRHLVFGDLRPADFFRAEAGWSATWRGTAADGGDFTINYRAQDERYIIEQRWRGQMGGRVDIPAATPFDQAMAEAFFQFYAEPPTVIDRLARKHTEENYQINVVDQPKSVREIVELPDGISRTIAFPIAINNMRPMWRWLKEQVRDRECPYPVVAESRLVFHALNFVEGKAAPWTTRPVTLSKQSFLETGLPPLSEPVREVADRDAAWTLRRLTYFLLIKVPFSGLSDFLERIETENGPIRSMKAPPLRFDMRPIVFSSGLEQRARNLVVWDGHKTVRSFIQWALPGREKPAPMTQKAIKSRDHNPAALLQVIEELGAKMSEAASE